MQPHLLSQVGRQQNATLSIDDNLLYLLLLALQPWELKPYLSRRS
ncbi:hypothetical protein GKIL_3840 [Gloeobacter kilaueensis JS1]|uniref:Uncharacterized protein n=1 Tax=Gloeobacter kilaueensis (strain ATCC BAA-2537 / CCAP 1431/1 / ULC 316 / JS1) TaxID=1183438 RepID=U5QMD9_GLOK1|nr:hypothetical protein GKIL_3840 [Gloeobacter kilaueensis JS1]